MKHNEWNKHEGWKEIVRSLNYVEKEGKELQRICKEKEGNEIYGIMKEELGKIVLFASIALAPTKLCYRYSNENFPKRLESLPQTLIF